MHQDRALVTVTLFAVVMILQAPAAAGAEIELACENKIYRISTGTGLGECVVVEDDGIKKAECRSDKGKLVAVADCVSGCGEILDAGECTVEERKPDRKPNPE